MLLLATGCWPTRDLRHFTLHGETKYVDPGRLNIDGVYYTIVREKSDGIMEYDDYVRCLAFYGDGTVLYLQDFPMRYVDATNQPHGHDVDETIRRGLALFRSDAFTHASDMKFWGAYKISGDTLILQRFERFKSQADGGVRLSNRVSTSKMMIVNDSTLRTVDKRNSVEFLFHKTIKPDSINLFSTNQRIRNKLARAYRARHNH